MKILWTLLKIKMLAGRTHFGRTNLSKIVAYLSCSAGRMHFARTSSGLTKFLRWSHALLSDQLFWGLFITLHQFQSKHPGPELPIQVNEDLVGICTLAPSYRQYISSRVQPLIHFKSGITVCTSPVCSNIAIILFW